MYASFSKILGCFITSVKFQSKIHDWNTLVIRNTFDFTKFYKIFDWRELTLIVLIHVLGSVLLIKFSFDPEMIFVHGVFYRCIQAND
jgi:hypothetical protein